MLEGSLAAMGAAVVSTPFEVVKIRLQLQGELQARSTANRMYKGTFHGLYLIVTTEGPRSVYKGLGSALVYQFTMNGIRLGLYDPLKDAIGDIVPSRAAASIVSACTLGFVSSLITSPLFLVKTRIQAFSGGSTIKVGGQHNYKHLADGLYRIAKAEGVRGLWHGAQLAAVRTATGSTVQLSVYDVLKVRLGVATSWQPNDSKLHLLSSLLTSGFVAVAMNPFDVVMTREYTNAANQYNANFFKAFYKITASEGIEGLFKGTGALWGRIGPHTVCSLVLLERIRHTRREWFPNWE